MARLTQVTLSLGSNQGDRFDILKSAISELGAQLGEIKKVSPIVVTPPWGFEADQDFFNLCLILTTSYSAQEAIIKIQSIEHSLGRVRTGEGYSSRPIDVDIIFFGNQVISTESLVIPHPRFYDRLFVLKPLTDLDPNLVDPITHLTVSQLLTNCIDKSPISEYEKRISPYD